MPKFRFTEGTSQIWDALEKLPRTGWVMRSVPEPETVKEHIMAARSLAVELSPELKLSRSELDDLLDILEVHDWPEAIVGDQVILGSEPNADELRSAKHEAEAAAMRDLTKTLPERELIRSLYERYENGNDKIASLAKQIDKLQAVLCAREYEDRHDMPGLTSEFIEYSKRYITEPVLLARMDDCTH